MTKTPEQMAEECVRDNTSGNETYEHGLRTGFLVGYQAAQTQWISVKERLPEEGQIVLTSCEQGKMFLLRKVSEEFLGSTLLWKYCCGYDKDLVDGESYCYEITHWMPLPEAPKEEK